GRRSRQADACTQAPLHERQPAKKVWGSVQSYAICRFSIGLLLLRKLSLQLLRGSKPVRAAGVVHGCGAGRRGQNRGCRMQLFAWRRSMEFARARITPVALLVAAFMAAHAADAVADGFTPTGNLSSGGRFGAADALLPDGSVLLAAGINGPMLATG